MPLLLCCKRPCALSQHDATESAEAMKLSKDGSTELVLVVAS